ncbi:hypothetical protein O0L34_g9497 [Tuta absoluta]|nr:hypothetical protein O0L34_g9497 [Tuta absoluta]
MRAEALLVIWLGVASAGVVRNMNDYPSVDELPCYHYTREETLHVDCSDRGFTDIPANIDSDVVILDLSNNNIASFPEALSNFTQLKVLDLSGNILNEPLPPFIENLTQLRTLNLSKNQYEAWAFGARSDSLRSLDLSKNRINIIDAAAISAMPSLSRLDLSENRIYDLPPQMFEAAPNLEILHLSRNYFSDVPKFQSDSLRTLHLSNCQISNLKPDSLLAMNSLLAIDLSINEIEQIPDSFASNTLQELDLSYNEITSLSDLSFSSLPHLAVLNLRGNGFREIWPTTHFASNPFLRAVYVKGNRWSCDGFSVNLLLTYEFLASKVADRGSLICYSPSNVTQMSWQQAYIQTWHFEKPMETYTVIAVMIGIIIGILITSMVCRGLMALNQPTPAAQPSAGNTNLNGVVTRPREESVEIRVPLRSSDQPPSYDEALLMPRLNDSFHSLPDFVDEESAESRHNYRRSRSIGDLTEHRPRTSDRRSVRRTVEIHMTQTFDVV